MYSRAVNEVYVCARGPMISQCGAEIYATIVDISTPLLESFAPGCMFSDEVRMVKEEKTTLNPEIKKPTPGVGELVSEVPNENASGAVGVVGSLFMLIITAMLVFW